MRLAWWCRGLGFGLWALGLWVGSAAVVEAHPGPSEPPYFSDQVCIVRLDKTQGTQWQLVYGVPVDDVDFTAGDIVLADAKSHEFFAVPRQVLSRQGRLWVADDEGGGTNWLRLPQWLSADDVRRAAAAVTPEDGTGFTADQVEQDEILDLDSPLVDLLRPLQPAEGRVPITQRQALRGVNWVLQDVPGGVYQIVAYVFSPPENAWAARSGLVKIVSATENPPAVTLDRVAAQVLTGQGRRISGCVDAEQGSTLEIAVRPQGASESAWEPWISPFEVGLGAYELCLPNPGLDAVVEVRAEVRTPDGLVARAYTSDVLTLFEAESDCAENENSVLCCPGSPDEAHQDEASQPLVDAGAARSPRDDAVLAGGGGCVAAGPGKPVKAQGWLTLGLVLLGWLARPTDRRPKSPGQR